MKNKAETKLGKQIHSVLTVSQKIRIRCITVLLTGQQFIDLLPAIELLTKLTDDLLLVQ